MISQECYTTLQIQKDASPSEIKTAYRRLALRYHPDKNSSPLAEEKFKKINEAYETLMKNTKGKGFDSFFSFSSTTSDKNDFLKNISRNFQEHFKDFQDYLNPTGFDDFCFPHFISSRKDSSSTSFFSDIFKDYNKQFSDSFNTPTTSSCFSIPKDPDLIKEVPLTLEEILYGKEKKITVTKTTSFAGSPVDRSKIYKINIKKGWQSGTKVTFLKEGNSLDQFHIPGDLVFVTVDKPHPFFTRDGADIRYKVSISLQEALCGTTIKIPTLDRPNTDTELIINDVIKPTTTKIIHGQGLPFLSRPEKRGDLVVEFDIQFPDVISPCHKALLVDCLRR